MGFVDNQYVVIVSHNSWTTTVQQLSTTVQTVKCRKTFGINGTRNLKIAIFMHNQGARLAIKSRLTSIGIPIIKIRRYRHRIDFNANTIPDHLDIEKRLRILNYLFMQLPAGDTHHISRWTISILRKHAYQWVLTLKQMAWYIWKMIFSVVND